MRTKLAAMASGSLRRSGLGDQSGSTAIEYALIGTGIGIAIIAAVFGIGDELVQLFELVSETLSGSVN